MVQCQLVSEKLARIYSQAHEKVAMRAQINRTRYNLTKCSQRS
jgi:hypothetical protein